jgi:hypothetical protein
MPRSEEEQNKIVGRKTTDIIQNLSKTNRFIWILLHDHMHIDVSGLSKYLQWSTVNLNTIQPVHSADNTTRITWG